MQKFFELGKYCPYCALYLAITSTYGKFCKIKPTTSMENFNGLRAMYNLVEENVHNLSSLGVPSDTCGKLLVHLLIRKFRHSLCLVFSREFDDKLLDLKNMLKYFKKRAFCKGTLCFVS